MKSNGLSIFLSLLIAVMNIWFMVYAIIVFFRSSEKLKSARIACHELEEKLQIREKVEKAKEKCKCRSKKKKTITKQLKMGKACQNPMYMTKRTSTFHSRMNDVEMTALSSALSEHRQNELRGKRSVKLKNMNS